jgi:D-alanyl-D-alanine carboxypeptidase/D-alanyl-D-alanine-endopeptidase (penicillin-binding protein 4)
LDAGWVQSLATPSPDPAAMAAAQQHLDALSALSLPVAKQGVWIQSEYQVLAEHQGTIPLSAASLTKIATSLAALATWGPDRQFETLISAAGSAKAGVLQGDLVVQGSGDPFFVWEEAIALGNALNQVGIKQVTGNLVITGNFAMNFETDPAVSGNLLKQGLDAKLWSAEVETQYQKLPPGTPRPQIAINGTIQVVPLQTANRASTLLIRHQSLPLVSLLKAMNTYSNNAMAEMLANSVGGAAAVAQKAAELAQVPPEEIRIFNGSGLGIENRISPRAIAAMLIATQRYLQARQLNIADLYPVIGRDGGTLEGRQTPLATVVKTGTLNQVSALAGVLPTRDRGLVWFSIIDFGEGDIQTFHHQQDLLLQELQQAWGTASPLPIGVQPDDLWKKSINRLGAVERNQKLVQG